MCLARGGVGGVGGEWIRGVGLDFATPKRVRGVVGRECFGCGGVGGVGGEWERGLENRMGRCGDVVHESLDLLCRWQVQVSVCCSGWIPAHLGCTQCDESLLHLTEYCFLTYICLLQISQIQTCLGVDVGPGLVSTSPAFMSSNASHSASVHGWLAQKTVDRAPISGGRDSWYNLYRGLPRHGNSPTACMLYHLGDL